MQSLDVQDVDGRIQFQNFNYNISDQVTQKRLVTMFISPNKTDNISRTTTSGMFLTPLQLQKPRIFKNFHSIRSPTRIKMDTQVRNLRISVNK